MQQPRDKAPPAGKSRGGVYPRVRGYVREEGWGAHEAGLSDLYVEPAVRGGGAATCSSAGLSRGYAVLAWTLCNL